MFSPQQRSCSSSTLSARLSRFTQVFSFTIKLLTLPILFLVLTQTSNAEVLFDHSATATTANTQGGLNSLTIPAFNVPTTLSANARILLVGVSIREPDDVNLAGFRTVASVTYGAASFTKLATVDRVGTPSNIRQVRVELWFLQAPATGSANVVVTLAGGQSAVFTTGVSLYYSPDTTETAISFRPQSPLCAPGEVNEIASGVTVTEFGDFGQGNNIADLHMRVLPDDMVVTVIGSDSTSNPQTVGTQEGFIPHQEFYSAFTSFGNAGGRITSGGFPVPLSALPCERTGWKTTGAMPYAMIGVVLIGTTGPTAAKMESFKAEQNDQQVKLNWQTSSEVDNLGYNIYRETKGIRTRINPSLIAGSALKVGANVKLKTGNDYTWFDQLSKKSKKVSYWIEEVDLSGESSWHGPIVPTADTSNSAFTKGDEALLLSKLTATQSLSAHPGRSYQLENKANAVEISAAVVNGGQGALAGKNAVKISVNKEGWYRITQPQLVAAGLPSLVEAKWLQLYVDGQEQPFVVNSGANGKFDSSSSIEFYGQGLDTPNTDTHVYWLIVGNSPGTRISKFKSDGQPSALKNFTYTAELKERTIYFAGLINGDANNFFGAIISPTAVNQVIPLQHIDFSSTAQAVLAINLQGVTQLAHRVIVQLNGNAIGEINFSGQSVGSNQFILPHSALLNGDNTINLIAANGMNDISLVDNIRITYQHKFIAENDSLRLSLASRDRFTIGGFSSSAIRVFDITNATDVQELTATIGGSNKNFSVSFAPRQNGQRTLFVTTNEQAQNPANLAANSISNWMASSNSADLIILTHRDFLSAAATLKTARQSEGYRTALVDIEDIYDEFSYGNKSPQAVKTFLNFTKTNWAAAPRFVLLMGGASFDARDYNGLGNSDFVPTKLVGATHFETACDDWFTDFNDDGIPEMFVGRLPVDTASAATQLVGKIINYQTNRPDPTALLVSDINDSFNFEESTSQLIPLLQGQLNIEEIRRGQFADPNVAKAQLLAAINSSKGFVNYVGHGSVGLWRGSLFTNADALALTNTKHSVFVSTTCLNAYHHDPLSLSLGQALLESSGGAVAVWSSSALNTPEEQAFINEEFYRQLFGTSSNLTIGEAATRAKSVVANKALRQTYILLGDPTMKVR
jgi:hypothetical protein